MNELEIAKSYYAAFNRQDWNEMLHLVSDTVIHYPNEGETRQGKERFIAFLKSMDVAYSEELKDIQFFQGEASNRIAVEFMVHGIYKKGEIGFPEAHGQKYCLPAGAFLTIENNKIQRITTYYNLEEWIRQVTAD